MLYAICHSVGWPTVGSLKNKGGEMDNLSAFEAQALIFFKNVITDLIILLEFLTLYTIYLSKSSSRFYSLSLIHKITFK